VTQGTALLWSNNKSGNHRMVLGLYVVMDRLWGGGGGGSRHSFPP